MKRYANDKAYKILISGPELDALKRHTWEMAESFGLDTRIERYKGTRPIGLYRWDMDCLIDILDMAMNDKRRYPDKTIPEYTALQNLYQRLYSLSRKAYDDLKTQ
jgi:hypothetical protein